MDQSLRDLILELHAIEAVKFGDFKMKCGLHSPVYFDLRVIVSYPKIMKTVSDVLWGVSYITVLAYD
jgi:uridine monophosphate synthetase